jgi:mannitol-specific phosphotransferase system IIBC component
MKRTDIAMIVLIAAVSAGLAYFVANSVLGNMTEQNVKVKTIDPITSVIQSPDPKLFTENAINPSVEVNINTTTANATTTPSTKTTATGAPSTTKTP